MDRNAKGSTVLFLLPSILILFSLIVIPLISSSIQSLFRDVSYLPFRYVGLANFQGLLKHPGFHQSLRFTLLFTLVAVPLELLVGTAFALLVHRPHRFRGLWRALLLIPWAIPTAVSARIWELIYQYSYGLANALLALIPLNIDPVNWTGSASSAFFSLVIADIWKTAPFVSILVLAGLLAIPKELYDQARVDGTHFLQRFRFLTLPLLKPVLLVALIFRTADTLRIFDLVFVLTNGGPGGSTASLSHLAFQYFVGGDAGKGNAISIMLFLLAFCIALIYLKLGKFRESLKT